MKHYRWALPSIIIMTLPIVSCGNKPMETHELAPIEVTTTRPDAAMPYGQGFENLAGQPPKVVATTALEKLCSFTAKEYDEGTVPDRLQGITTPAAWRSITDDPRTIVAPIILRTWDTWNLAGGQQQVTVEVTEEEHPVDTETAWQRKVVCYRQMDGFDEQFLDVYIIGLEKTRGQWRVSALELISSNTLHPANHNSTQ